MTDQILLIEDDFALGDELFDSLDAQGYKVTWIKDGAEAYREPIEAYDLVVLDLMLPGKHGFDVLKKYRENSDVPVIILTARRETRDKLRGFELGSDDFMTKPFLPEELLARVRARLRRPVMRREADRELGPMSIDFDGRTVSVDGEPVELTAVEFDILTELARRPGMALSRRNRNGATHPNGQRVGGACGSVTHREPRATHWRNINPPPIRGEMPAKQAEEAAEAPRVGGAFTSSSYRERPHPLADR